MSRQMRKATKTTSMKFFMVALSLVASISGSLLFSHRTHALAVPLVHHVTSLLRDVLTDPAAPAQTTPATTNGDEMSTSSASQPATSHVTPTVAPTNKEQTARVVALSPLPTLEPVKTNWLPPNNPHVTSTHLMATDDMAQVGVADTATAFLTPTTQGWSIFGVLWYWWLGVIMVVGAGFYRSLHLYRSYLKSALVS